MNDDNRKLAKDVGAYGAIAAARSGISLLTIPVIVNTLTMDEFVTIEFVNAALAFFTLILLRPNIGFARYYFMETREDDANRSFSGIFVLYLGASGVCVLAILCSLLLSLDQALTDAVRAIFWAAVSLPALILFELLLFRLRLDGRKWLFFSATFGEAAFRAALVIGLVMVWPDPAVYFLAAFVVSFCAVFVLLFMLRPFRDGFSFELPRNAYRLVLPSYPGVCVAYANQHGIKFLALIWVTLDDFAQMALALKLAVVVKLIIKALKLAWTPISMRLVSEGPDRAKRFLSNTLSLYAVSAVVALLLLSVAGGPLLLLVVPESYAGSGAFVPLIAANVLLGGSYVVLEVGTIASANNQWHSYAALLAAVVGVATVCLLSPVLGVEGLAYGMMFGSLCNALVILYGAQRHYAVDYPAASLALLFVGLPAAAIGLNLFLR